VYTPTVTELSRSCLTCLYGCCLSCLAKRSWRHSIVTNALHAYRLQRWRPLLHCSAMFFSLAGVYYTAVYVTDKILSIRNAFSWNFYVLSDYTKSYYQCFYVFQVMLFYTKPETQHDTHFITLAASIAESIGVILGERGSLAPPPFWEWEDEPHLASPLRETHMPYGNTQCYLTPGRGENPAFTPSRNRYSITRLSDPGECKAELTYVTWKRTGCESNPQPVNRKSNALPQRHHATHGATPGPRGWREIRSDTPPAPFLVPAHAFWLPNIFDAPPPL